MKEAIIVNTGEVKTGNGNAVLKSSPIGSCVAVILFAENEKAGGMAHIMLPGSAPEKDGTVKTRYAQNAIDELLMQLMPLVKKRDKLKAVLVGGGNVLKRKNDNIGILNLESIEEILRDKNILVIKRGVKGTERRSARFDIGNGVIYTATGDDIEKTFHQV